MPGHKDPEYEVKYDDKGRAYVKMIREVVVEEEPKPKKKVSKKKKINPLYQRDE